MFLESCFTFSATALPTVPLSGLKTYLLRLFVTCLSYMPSYLEASAFPPCNVTCYRGLENAVAC